ncbi:hypothetical protein [Streptomyces lunalinharesii]|uniref:Uncharacterized protein n=1 Tax=Streptomyces lunalinharesii TaxID=333384 RepID=A0ABN3SHA8_9ACTN
MARNPGNEAKRIDRFVSNHQHGRELHAVPEWSFTLRLNQALTPEQADVFDHCDAFADGSVSYVLGPSDPGKYPLHDPGAAELRELSCDVEAPTLLDAVAQVARDIRLVPGLRVVGVRPGTWRTAG